MLAQSLDDPFIRCLQRGITIAQIIARHRKLGGNRGRAVHLSLPLEDRIRVPGE